MANWFYYENGQKVGPLTLAQVATLARIGKITPETVLETEMGKSAPAAKVKGLEFPTQQPQAAPQRPQSLAPATNRAEAGPSASLSVGSRISIFA